LHIVTEEFEKAPVERATCWRETSMPRNQVPTMTHILSPPMPTKS